MQLSGLRASVVNAVAPRSVCGLPLPKRIVLSRVASAESTEQIDFVTELRQLAMSLHTKDQAKSGKQKTAPKPFKSWEYTREGYLQFLVESKHVYEAFERIVASDDTYALFRDTGLERVEALHHDIAWIAADYDLPLPALSEDSPSVIYVKVLEDLSRANPPAFVCHFYNYYLAHTAGGRMIGKKVADQVFFGDFDRFAFYRYNSNLKGLVTDLKASINRVADGWSRDEKDASLAEAMECFKYSGMVMKTMFSGQA